MVIWNEKEREVFVDRCKELKGIRLKYEKIFVFFFFGNKVTRSTDLFKITESCATNWMGGKRRQSELA